MKDPKDQEWLSAASLSIRLGISSGTIYRWVDDKMIEQGVHYLVAGNKYLFSWEAIFEWASTHPGDRDDRRRRRSEARKTANSEAVES